MVRIAWLISIAGRTVMLERISIVASVLLATIAAASAFDQTKYPDLQGQWRRGPNTSPAVEARGRGNVFDPSKGWGPAQQPPLTPEYQARFEANLADQAAGGQGLGETYTCVSPGMPRVTNGYGQSASVAGADRVVLARIFHRPMDRYRRRRQIRPARGRDPRLHGAAHFRCQRHS